MVHELPHPLPCAINFPCTCLRTEVLIECSHLPCLFLAAARQLLVSTRSGLSAPASAPGHSVVSRRLPCPRPFPLRIRSPLSEALHTRRSRTYVTELALRFLRLDALQCRAIPIQILRGHFSRRNSGFELRGGAAPSLLVVQLDFPGQDLAPARSRPLFVRAELLVQATMHAAGAYATHAPLRQAPVMFPLG